LVVGVLGPLQGHKRAGWLCTAELRPTEQAVSVAVALKRVAIKNLAPPPQNNMAKAGRTRKDEQKPT
jgi:hypothetical protein